MMERMLLGVFCLAGLHSFSSGLPHQYHYVDESLNWTEAQTYCREKYTDLVTIENLEDMNQLNNTVSSSGYSYEVWIGLYGSVDWRWSGGYSGSGADYRGWGPDEPDDPLCVAIEKSASGSFSWVARDCASVYEVICDLGTPEAPSFLRTLVNRSWSDAENHCKGSHTKMPTIINDMAYENIQTVIAKTAWIGLYGKGPGSSWSDGSNSTFRDWVEGSDPAGLKSAKGLCGAVNLEESQKWNLSRCERRLPFVCYGAPKPPAAKRHHVIKLRMKPDDPSVNLNDPAVRAQILEKLQDKLKENQVSGVSLKWKEQPDGKVFLKEMKKSSEEIGKDVESNLTCLSETNMDC